MQCRPVMSHVKGCHRLRFIASGAKLGPEKAVPSPDGFFRSLPKNLVTTRSSRGRPGRIFFAARPAGVVTGFCFAAPAGEGS